MTPFEKEIEAVVDSILADYSGQRDIDKLELYRKPDKDVVIDIIEKLRRIVFPGYFKDKNYRMYNAKNNLSMLIEDVMFHLTHQIALVFQSGGELEESAQVHAQDVCLAFSGRFPTCEVWCRRICRPPTTVTPPPLVWLRLFLPIPVCLPSQYTALPTCYTP